MCSMTYMFEKLTVVDWMAGNGDIFTMAAVVIAPAIMTTDVNWSLITNTFNFIQPYCTMAASVHIAERHTNIPSTAHSTPSQWNDVKHQCRLETEMFSLQCMQSIQHTDTVDWPSRWTRNIHPAKTCSRITKDLIQEDLFQHGITLGKNW